MTKKKFEIDMTPNLDTGEGEWEKLLNMADKEGWK